MAGLATAESANRKLLVSHVLIKDTAKAPLIFDDLEKKLSSGRSSFTELAREHSECSQSSHMGGQLGWLQRGTYFPEFEAAVFALGITSGSITRAQTSIGWHLIKVDDVREEALVQQMDPTELLEVLGNPGLVRGGDILITLAPLQKHRARCSSSV
jgi:parvulin-like peptidyl-prolyl isomerase